MKAIRYVINPDGTVTLDFNGFKGKVCLDEFKRIEEALRDFGVVVDGLKREYKQEYYEQEEVQEQ